MELQKVQRTTLTMKEASEFRNIILVDKSISKKKTNTMFKSWWEIFI